jgi:broad specificity phosphatase PhoE
MKLILIRHEERINEIGFFSELTEKGIYYSKYIIPNEIDKIIKYSNKVDAIFSSPYYRTLETIQYYAEKYNKKINIENSLCEYVNNTYFIYNKWKYDWTEIHNPKYYNLKKIFNNNYHSLISINDINNVSDNILESEIEFKNRINNFINYLKNNYEQNSVIILSTHMNVINMIYYLYNNENNNENLLDVKDFGKIITINI